MKKGRHYQGVTPEVFEEMKANLAAEGAEISGGQKGRVGIHYSGMTFRLEYEWDGEDCLAIAVVKKPFVVREGKVFAKIEAMLAEVGIERARG